MPTVKRSTGVYLGIDPGASGGMAVIGSVAGVELLPIGSATHHQAWHWLSSFSVTMAVVEKVGGFIAGNPAPGSAMFNFGKGAGILTGFLIAAAIPFEEVIPRTWQKSLGIAPREKTESKTEFKRRLKGKAEQLFPQVKVTLATCDALLIAEFCRRNHR